MIIPQNSLKNYNLWTRGQNWGTRCKSLSHTSFL